MLKCCDGGDHRGRVRGTCEYDSFVRLWLSYCVPITLGCLGLCAPIAIPLCTPNSFIFVYVFLSPLSVPVHCSRRAYVILLGQCARTLRGSRRVHQSVMKHYTYPALKRHAKLTVPSADLCQMHGCSRLVRHVRAVCVCFYTSTDPRDALSPIWRDYRRVLVSWEKWETRHNSSHFSPLSVRPHMRACFCVLFCGVIAFSCGNVCASAPKRRPLSSVFLLLFVGPQSAAPPSCRAIPYCFTIHLANCQPSHEGLVPQSGADPRATIHGEAAPAHVPVPVRP